MQNGCGSQKELTLEKLISTKQHAIVKFAKFICLKINPLYSLYLHQSCFVSIYKRLISAFSSDPPSPPVNITVSFTETTVDITWTPSSISSSQCITSYTVNTTTNNTNNFNTTDTSISIPLTGLSAGMYCISIASIDTANRIGTHSEQECFELTGF